MVRTGGMGFLFDEFLLEFFDGNVGGGNAAGAGESAQGSATGQHRHVVRKETVVSAGVAVRRGLEDSGLGVL